VFIIYASTTTMVVQRLPAMATLVTLGAGPRELVRAVVAEAALLGAIGSIVGVGLGLFLASFIGEDAAAGMALNYSLPFEAGRTSWEPLVVFVVHPIGGVLAAACSAYLPARRLRFVTPLLLQRDDDSMLHRSMVSPAGALAVAAVPSLLGTVALSYGVTRGSASWVSAGGILVIAGAVLAMLPVLRALWTASGPILSKRFGVAGTIASENLVRSMDRSLVTASAITLSVAIAVGSGSLVQSFRASVADWYGFAGDAIVSSRSVTGGWLAAPVGRELEQPLRALAAVASVETLRVLQGQPYREERIALAALSEGLLRKAIEEGDVLGHSSEEAALAAVARGYAVAVSQNFATHFSVVAGQPLELPTVAGAVRLPVVAIVPDYISDKGSVLMSRDLLAAHWNDRLVNYYAVQLADDAAVSELARQVEASLPGSDGLAVTATSRMIERVDGLIGKAFADIATIQLLVLFLTTVGIADLVVSNVLSRRRELAVLRLVGLTDAQVIRTARLEGVCVTLAAAGCGTVVGVVCAWLWVHYNYPALVGYVLELELAWSSIFVSLALAALSASAASTIAARYALRQPALSAIRFE
ncbi:MAG: FtsX-like permease family protein, partial [Candidatus Binatia bacterium]